MKALDKLAASGTLTPRQRGWVERLEGDPEDVLTLAQVAEVFGITLGSARTNYARARQNRAQGFPKPTDMPMPDVQLGRSIGWRRSTLRAWAMRRIVEGRAI